MNPAETHLFRTLYDGKAFLYPRPLQTHGTIPIALIKFPPSRPTGREPTVRNDSSIS